MASVQLPLTTVGYTQASIVMPVLRSSEGASGIVMSEFVPLNTRAFPYLPDVVQVALVIVPVLPFPERSLTVVPVPSSKEYAATSPEIVFNVVAVAVVEYGLKFPAASVALTWYV